MMTRKDYINLAAAISATVEKSEFIQFDASDTHNAAILTAQEIAGQIGNVLAADNPNFDWERWINACNTGA